MTAPANALHGWLGWCLLTVIAGHVGMALVHHYRLRDATLTRMLGGGAPSGANAAPAEARARRQV